MSKPNGTRQVKWYETCEYKYRLDASVCISKQRCNKDKCRCECKELIGKGICHLFIWNPSNFECECDKSCDVGEYLDYENCMCRRNKLVEECTENIDEVKIAATALFERRNECKSSCTIYVLLIFTISIGIGTYFIYYKYRYWYLFYLLQVHES